MLIEDKSSINLVISGKDNLGQQSANQSPPFDYSVHKV